MTTVYSDYYDAYDTGAMDIANVDFNVKLVLAEYEPDGVHKPEDVKKYIVNGVSVFVDTDITTKSMGELIQKAKDKMELCFKEFGAEVAEAAKELVNETVQEAMRNFQPDGFWELLRDNGVGYFVVEYPELGILCFTEPI